MTKSVTPRMGLTQWSATTDAPIRTDFNTSFAQIEALTAIDGQGTAFPAAPAQGQWFLRTDTGVQYRWDGTQWRFITGTSGLAAVTWSKSVMTLGTGDIRWQQISAQLVSVNGAVTCSTADGGNFRTYITMPAIPLPSTLYPAILNAWLTNTTQDGPSALPLIYRGTTWWMSGETSNQYVGAIAFGQQLQISGTYRIAA